MARRWSTNENDTTELRWTRDEVQHVFNGHDVIIGEVCGWTEPIVRMVGHALERKVETHPRSHWCSKGCYASLDGEDFPRLQATQAAHRKPGGNGTSAAGSMVRQTNVLRIA